MADNKSQSNEAVAAPGESASRSGGHSMVAMVKVVSFVTVVVAAECLLAYFYLPSPAETTAWAEAAMTASADELSAEPEPGEEAEEMPADQVEVDLEEFSVSAFQPISNTSLRIDFHLYGIVGAEDEAEFTALLEENRHRFREQVLVIARSADLSDLTDAGLGLIKRQILEKTNNTLGKPLLRAVIFSDFSFIEQ